MEHKQYETLEYDILAYSHIVPGKAFLHMKPALLQGIRHGICDWIWSLQGRAWGSRSHLRDTSDNNNTIISCVELRNDSFVHGVLKDVERVFILDLIWGGSILNIEKEWMLVMICLKERVDARKEYLNYWEWRRKQNIDCSSVSFDLEVEAKNV